MFFNLPTWALALVVVAVIGGSIAGGLLAAKQFRKQHDDLREPLGVLQAALLGVVGLVLAFGLTMAVGRYGPAARPWLTSRTPSARPTFAPRRCTSRCGRSR